MTKLEARKEELKIENSQKRHEVEGMRNEMVENEQKWKQRNQLIGKLEQQVELFLYLI